MAFNERQVWKEAVQAALAFHDRKLWREFPNEAFFGATVPTEERPVVLSVLGAEGMEYGLAFFRGRYAIAHTQAMLGSEILDIDLLEETSQMGLCIQPLQEIPEPFRKNLKRAGFAGRPTSPAPLVLVKEPGHNPREARKKEMKTVLYVLRGILKAHDEGVLRREKLPEGKEILALDISGDPLDPQLSTSVLSLENAEKPRRAHAVVPPATLDRLPHLDMRWIVGLPVLPVCIARDRRSVRGLVVVDEESTYLLHIELVSGNDRAAAARLLYKVFQGDNTAGLVGLPEEIAFSSRVLHDAVARPLSLLGVRCRYEADLPILTEILEDLGRTIAADHSER